MQLQNVLVKQVYGKEAKKVSMILNSKRNQISQSKGDRIFNVINYSILAVLLLLVLYPLYFMVIASISDPDLVGNGQVIFLPHGLTLDGYFKIFEDSRILTGYRNTIFYTILGTGINLFCTIPCAYALSRRDLVGRKYGVYLFVFTMMFSGGLIPTYILMDKLNLVGTFWPLMLIGTINPYNLIVAKTYFENTLPLEVLEAAIVDGCSNTKFFMSIAVPLSKPIIAVMALMYGVTHWNEYFRALIYLSRSKTLFTLQVVLRDILVVNDSIATSGGTTDIEFKIKLAEQMKYAVIILANIPLILVYPFIQKYFVKGIMIGAIKG